MPGPVSATETSTSPLTCAALTPTAPPAGVNFTAFESRLKITCLIRRSSPSTTSTSGSAASSTSTPSLVARSRTITTPRSSASRSENGATSSSICPASTLDRSRTSLISASRWLAGGEDVVEVLRLLLVHLAEHPLAQHLGEAEDRVQRRPQLVRHVGQELGLVPAGRLELAALLVQLGECRRELSSPLLDLLLEAGVRLLEPRRHPIELLGQRAELVVGSRPRSAGRAHRSRSSPPRPGSTRSAARACARAGRWSRPPAAGTRRAGARVRQIADLSGANASLSGSSTKTRQPRGSMVWKALSTFVPSWSCPIVTVSAAGRGARSAARTCGSDAKFVCRRTRLRSGWVTSSPRASTAYAYPAVPIRARSMTSRMELRSMSATTTPRPGAARRRRSSCAAGSRAGSTTRPKYRCSARARTNAAACERSSRLPIRSISSGEMRTAPSRASR